MRKLLASLLACVAVLSSTAAGVRLGMSRAEVEAELGRPNAVMQRDDRTILIYPGDGRVVLKGGQVIDAARVTMSEESTAVQPPPVVPVPPAESAEKAAATPAEPDTDAAMLKAHENAQRQLEDATEQLAAGPAMPDLHLTPAPAQFWAGLAIGAVIQCLVTVVILKLAFKWADVHADWGQMWLPAFADMAVRSAIQAVAYALWKADQLFYIDDAVAYLALLFTLLKTTHACTFPRAVAVAGGAKVASVVVWTFLSVALLHMLA